MADRRRPKPAGKEKIVKLTRQIKDVLHEYGESYIHAIHNSPMLTGGETPEQAKSVLLYGEVRLQLQTAIEALCAAFAWQYRLDITDLPNSARKYSLIFTDRQKQEVYRVYGVHDG